MNRGRLCLGLMSGTSADGVSAALVRVGDRSVQVLAHRTYPYSGSLRRRILAARDGSVPEVSRLNFEMGRLFARTVRRFCREHRAPLKRIEVIGSHGQTVYHGAMDSVPNTLQIAEPSVIAEATGIPVVADFRPRDVAAGGQGAPLAPFLDLFVFGKGPLRAVQNIGGIGNVSVVGRGKVHAAFDTGPGNSLMDTVVQTVTRGRRCYDRGGAWASRGRIDSRVAESMLKDPYFSLRPPKSLDRAYFGLAFLRRHFRRISRGNSFNVLATLNYFTARSIERSYRRFVLPRFNISEVVLSGGGALNPVLVRHLKGLLNPIPVLRSENLGIPSLAKEPACFALMAERALRGLPNHCPEATGARGPRILGKIILP